MSETRYLISEASRITQVEAHVLRYWEEELGLSIGRNSMGHRYYTDKDIRIFMNIKELKKKGLQLRAIRDIISSQEVQEKKQEEELPRVIVMRPQIFQKQEADSEKNPESDTSIISGDRESKQKEKGTVRGKQADEQKRKVPEGSGKSQDQGKVAVKEKCEGENKDISRNLQVEGKDRAKAAVGFSKKEQQFGEIMERLIRQLENGEKKEERYRRLDAAIRRHQQSRKMAAATEENGRKRKNRKKKKS